MRPTKYRIWDKEREIWKEDYHYHLAPNGQLYYDGMNITEHNEIVFWTGLHDCNGKEIYEGYIGKRQHAIYLIEWNVKNAQYQAKIIKTKSVLTKNCSFPLWQYVEDDGKCRFKVIGNVWEHPHLLQEGDSKDA